MMIRRRRIGASFIAATAGTCRVRQRTATTATAGGTAAWIFMERYFLQLALKPDSTGAWGYMAFTVLRSLCHSTLLFVCVH